MCSSVYVSFLLHSHQLAMRLSVPVLTLGKVTVQTLHNTGRTFQWTNCKCALGTWINELSCLLSQWWQNSPLCDPEPETIRRQIEKVCITLAVEISNVCVLVRASRVEGARCISSACGPETPLSPWVWKSVVNHTFHFLPFHNWCVPSLCLESCDLTLGYDVQPFLHA